MRAYEELKHDASSLRLSWIFTVNVIPFLCPPFPCPISLRRSNRFLAELLVGPRNSQRLVLQSLPRIVSSLGSSDSGGGLGEGADASRIGCRETTSLETALARRRECLRSPPSLLRIEAPNRRAGHTLPHHALRPKTRVLPGRRRSRGDGIRCRRSPAPGRVRGALRPCRRGR